MFSACGFPPPDDEEDVEDDDVVLEIDLSRSEPDESPTKIMEGTLRET